MVRTRVLYGRDELEEYLSRGPIRDVSMPNLTVASPHWLIEVEGQEPVITALRSYARRAEQLWNKQRGIKVNEYFSPVVDEDLLRWLRGSSWHSGHPHDQRRFYDFARLLVDNRRRHYRNKAWREGFRSVVRRAIKDEFPRLPDEWIDQELQRFVQSAETIFAYEDISFWP